MLKQKMAAIEHTNKSLFRKSALICAVFLLWVFYAAVPRVDIDQPESPSGSQSIVAQAVQTGYAIPLPTLQLNNRTEVRTGDRDKETSTPSMRGATISHFQNEDPSFWVSRVTRIQPSTLQVIRI